MAVKTNGCTLAPNEKFKTCCDLHDIDYSKETTVSRREADDKLFRCILRKGEWFIVSHIYYFLLASLYWCGVRVFGLFWYRKK